MCVFDVGMRECTFFVFTSKYAFHCNNEQTTKVQLHTHTHMEMDMDMGIIIIFTIESESGSAARAP